MPSLNPAHWDQEQFAILLNNTPSTPQKTAYSTQEAIANHHPLSAYAGLQALQLGGSAADALVTMIAVDTVVQPGSITLAGSLGLIIHETMSGETHTLNAGFNRVLNDTNDYDHETHHSTGRAVLVPGVVAGLETLWHRFGVLPWTDLWRPAIYFAREGFILNDDYIKTLQRRQDILLRYPEGRAIFAPDGKLPEKGALFRQPQLAETLKKVSLRGTTYFYKGDWARHLINAIHRHEGAMRLEDMQLYQARWEPPLSGCYLNYEIRTLPPPHYGGAMLLHALAIAEELELHTRPTRTASAETLFEELQIFKTIVSAHNLLIDPQHASTSIQTMFNQTLTEEQARIIAASIRQKEIIQPEQASETNAHHIVAIDRLGNIISAAHTNASDAWGDTGIFVEGIALNSSADQLQRRLPRAGARVSEPLAAYIILQAGKPLLVAGASGAGSLGCNLQNILNILAHKMGSEESIGQPRWGTCTPDDRAIQIDSFAPDIIQQVKQMGQPLGQSSHIDTGHWTAISIDPKTGAFTAVTEPRLIGN
jgi:gamma-glutamyltranspeptidase / glutathione hydrolase